MYPCSCETRYTHQEEIYCMLDTEKLLLLKSHLRKCTIVMLFELVKPTDFVDPYGAKNHLHKIT